MSVNDFLHVLWQKALGWDGSLPHCGKKLRVPFVPFWIKHVEFSNFVLSESHQHLPSWTFGFSGRRVAVERFVLPTHTLRSLCEFNAEFSVGSEHSSHLSLYPTISQNWRRCARKAGRVDRHVRWRCDCCWVSRCVGFFSSILVAPFFEWTLFRTAPAVAMFRIAAVAEKCVYCCNSIAGNVSFACYSPKQTSERFSQQSAANHKQITSVLKICLSKKGKNS